MQVYFHIGRHKTATTAIQMLLAEGYDILREQGILYPQAGREGKYLHHPLALALLDGDEAALGRYGTELKEEIEATRTTAVILSSEILSRERVTATAFDRARALFPDAPMKLVVYLRRQDDQVRSMYAEGVKRGFMAWPGNIRTTEGRLTLDYMAALAPAISVFGTNNIIVRSFDAERKNIVGSFFEACGLVPPHRADAGERNRRLFWRSIEAMRFANSLPSPLKSRARTVITKVDNLAHRKRFLAWMDRPDPLPREEAQRILKDAEPSNREIERLFFCGRTIFPRVGAKKD